MGPLQVSAENEDAIHDKEQEEDVGCEVEQSIGKTYQKNHWEESHQAWNTSHYLGAVLLWYLDVDSLYLSLLLHKLLRIQIVSLHILLWLLTYHY